MSTPWNIGEIARATVDHVAEIFELLSEDAPSHKQKQDYKLPHVAWATATVSGAELPLERNQAVQWQGRHGSGTTWP